MTYIMRVRAVSTGWTGGPGLNTVYFIKGDDALMPELADAQLAADRVRAAFFDARTGFPSSWRCSITPAVDVLVTETGALAGSLGVTPPAEVLGDNVAGFGPTPAMVLCKLNTNTFSDGSRLQGRHFLGPTALMIEGNGTPTAALLTEVGQYGTALGNAGPGGVPKVVVWRRPREASAGPPVVTARAGSFGIVTSYSTQDKFAILRSRRD